MSLLGIDVGTTGSKAAVFSEEGELVSSAYREHDVDRPKPGWAELNSVEVWDNVKWVIGKAVSSSTSDPVRALSVSSLGEAMVPVTADRRILGSSVLNFDTRGQEHLDALRSAFDEERLYRICGSRLGSHYSLPKLLWIREHQPSLFQQTAKFLLWGSFVSFMLGADPVVDYSLAHATLLFDVGAESWSEDVLEHTAMDLPKLAATAPAGRVIGKVSSPMASELGLPADALIVLGAHDQCVTALGCGVIGGDCAAYGMGSYTCITVSYSERREPALMLELGLSTEHHAVPGKYVSMVSNRGGSLVKWFRDTFAAEEHRQAVKREADVYSDLMSEMPEGLSSVDVVPSFDPVRRSGFLSGPSGALSGLRLDTSRGDILKGILEGSTLHLKHRVESLRPAGIRIDEYRPVGGGSRSDVWVQTCADVMGRPFVRPRVTEAGMMGAAILAGVGAGTFPSFEAGIEAMVRLERAFEPDPTRQRLYEHRFEQRKQAWPLLAEYLGATCEPSRHDHS
jgi:xylulokinase